MPDDSKSLPTLAGELWELVLTYLKQETLEPLKGIGRFIGLGLAGAAATAIGLVLLVLGLLRLLQTETAPHLAGHLSWLPYIIVLVVSAGLAMAFASLIGSRTRKANTKGTIA